MTKPARKGPIRMLPLIPGGLILLCLSGCISIGPRTMNAFRDIRLDYDTPLDPVLQAAVERIDAELRARYGMTPEQSAVGVLELATPRLAMIHPDSGAYAASVPKIGILLAWFQLHPQAA